MAIGILYSIPLMAQKKEDFLKSKLNPGFPEEIDFIRNQMNLSGVSQSLLKTGIDTLDFKFGEFAQNGNKGYWISLFSNEKMLTWTTVQLFLNEESGLLSNTIEVDFDNSSKMISLHVKHDPVTDEILYQWRNKTGISEIASIEVVERPIQENKPMPYFTIKTIEGADLSLNDFKGKYLVINWWATTCGPCIAEMPGLNKLVEKYQARDDVAFLAIAWDDKEKVERFLNKRNFMYQQTIGSKELVPIFGESFPKHIILNPDGLVTYYSEGGSVETHLDIERTLNLLSK